MVLVTSQPGPELQNLHSLLDQRINTILTGDYRDVYSMDANDSGELEVGSPTPVPMTNSMQQQAVGYNSSNMLQAVCCNSSNMLRDVGCNRSIMSRAVGGNCSNMLRAVGYNCSNMSRAVGGNSSNMLWAVGCNSSNMLRAVGGNVLFYCHQATTYTFNCCMKLMT